MSAKIIITHHVHPPALDTLKGLGEIVINDQTEPWSEEELKAQCQNADAVMVFMTETIDADFLRACPKLKIIAGALKGYNNIDLQACTDRNVLLTIVPDLLTEPTAELTVGLMIALARNFISGDQHIRSNVFQGWRPKFYGGSLNNSTIGIIGAGAVGQSIMRQLRGFNCKKLYVDKHSLSHRQEQELGANKADLNEALAKSDFLVLALHLMPSTLHLVDADFLQQMKPGSYLINPARGSLVDEAAIVEALENGQLAGYAADTFEMEDWAIKERPKTIHSSLLNNPNTILTPHIGSAVTSVRRAIEVSAAESIKAALSGEIPLTAVNGDDISRGHI